MQISKDAVFYVRKAWTKLLSNVYLSSLDTFAVKQIQQSTRIWFNDSSNTSLGLVGEFCEAIHLLFLRLENRPAPAEGAPTEDLTHVADSVGTDLGSHFGYVLGMFCHN